MARWRLRRTGYDYIVQYRWGANNQPGKETLACVQKAATQGRFMRDEICNSKP